MSTVHFGGIERQPLTSVGVFFSGRFLFVLSCIGWIDLWPLILPNPSEMIRPSDACMGLYGWE